MEEKTIRLQPECIDLDDDDSDEEEYDSTRPIFQRFKGNFGIVALECLVCWYVPEYATLLNIYHRGSETTQRRHEISRTTPTNIVSERNDGY